MLFCYSRFIGCIWPKLISGSEEEFLVRRHMLQSAWWPQMLSVPVGKRLLVISPHPDDEAIGAGGLLLAHKGKSEVHILCLTDGQRGGALASPPSDPVAARNALVLERRRELSQVAAELGAVSVQFCGFPDGALPCDDAAASRVRSLVSSVRPDVVLLPWLFDKHPDHRASNRLYAMACHDLECLVLGYEIWGLVEPNAYFDISELLPQKLDLIRKYVTQLRTVNYLDYMQALATVRAFHGAARPNHGGALEAFVALPNTEYCQLVQRLYRPLPKGSST